MKPKKAIKWLYGYTKPFIPSLTVIMIFGTLLALSTVGAAVASQKMIDFAVARDLNSAWIAALVFFGVVLAQIALRALQATKTAATQERFLISLRTQIYSHIVKVKWGEFSRYHSDDIMTRLTSDVSVVTDGVTNVLPGILTLCIQLVVAFVTLFIYDPVLAILAILLGPAAIVFYYLFRKRLKEMHIKIQEAESVWRAFLHECVQNISIVKVFSFEGRSVRKLEQQQNDLLNKVLARNKLNVLASSILALGYHSGYMISFAWGAFRLAQNRITFGTLTAFFQLVNQIQSPFISIARTIPQLIATEGSANRLMELEALAKEEVSGVGSAVEKAGIRLDHVAFGYKEDKPVIQDATAEIRPGETVAVIGASGEGKTTLIRLILSLIDKQHGKIVLTDQNKEWPVDASCRELISYVPQGNTLFSGTILENLCMGVPDPSHDDVCHALKAASAYDFVFELKDNLQTVIGEKGLGLSEGQAQRLAIARALLKRAPILIFDEATSALDEKTEMNVLEAIRQRESHPTCIFITHRPGVYALSDRIIKLENGSLIEITNPV